MVDINIQLTNIITFLMKKMDIKEIEIPERILLEDGQPLIGIKDPINPNIRIRIGDE